MSEEWIIRFEDVGRNSIALAGGKGASLGEMMRIRMPVPPGFLISSKAYTAFLNETRAGVEIASVLGEFLKGKSGKEEEISNHIRCIIEEKKIPKKIKNNITKAYNEMHHGAVEATVAVRSSGLAEDSPTLSFAGQFETFLNVKGEDDLLESVKLCWASLFTARAISYRIQNGLLADGGSICVVVQKMVNARSAGICFTIDPVTGNPLRIVIEGNWGLGESVVQGMVTPDMFKIDKEKMEILTKRVSKKVDHVVPKGRGTGIEKVTLEKRDLPCLNDEEIKRIAELAKTVESHYGCYQDLEWAIDANLPFPQMPFLFKHGQ